MNKLIEFNKLGLRMVMLSIIIACNLVSANAPNANPVQTTSDVNPSVFAPISTHISSEDPPTAQSVPITGNANPNQTDPRPSLPVRRSVIV